MNADKKWQLEVTSLISEIHTNQKNLSEKMDTHISKSDSRFDKLDKIVIGNGHKGLAEEVRDIKGKWGAAYTIAMLLLQGLTVYGVHILTK